MQMAKARAETPLGPLGATGRASFVVAERPVRREEVRLQRGCSSAPWHGRCNSGGMSNVEGLRAGAVTHAVEEPVVALLERFFHYLTLQHVEPAVQLWDLPALILGDHHVHGPMSRPQLERLFEEVTPVARSESSIAGQRPRAGSRQGSYVSDEDCVWISERVARVRAHWPEQRYGGFLSGVETTEFFVRVDEGGLPKIRALMLLPPDFPRPLGKP